MTDSILTQSDTHPVHTAVNQILSTHGIPLQKLVSRLIHEKRVTGTWIAETINKDRGYVSRALNKSKNNNEIIHLWWEKYPNLTYEEFEKEVSK